MSDKTQNPKAIFGEALAIDSPEKRSAFLDKVCGDNSPLREEVNDLLHAFEEAGSFMARPVLEPQATLDQPPLEKPGTQIGPYKLLEEIGEGGMGVVYMAEQKQPIERRVALKIIKPGMDTRQVIARFEAEEQALAMMDHPNIAKVFDAGTTDSGRPYFVMELVNGIPVTQYCDQQHLTARERLELFIPICQAVQHAHQKGIIHRDIKPTNILVALYDGRPVPKVIDFGVAKATGSSLTEKTMFTGLGQIVGTLEYMSPEQANRNQLDIDTRSDVYSLGVVLYELLTGDTPFDKQRLRSAAIDELLRIIREEEPPKPSTKLSSSETLPSVAANRHIEPAKLSALVRGELDWIVMKALEKDRARRYETASSFAADVAHYLNDEPVLACPPSVRYRFGKFARRNKGRLVTASLLAAALLVTVGGVGWAVRDREARQERVSEQVELLLAGTDRLMQEQQWDEALATARRAEAVLGAGEADPTTKEKVQAALTELEFVARLNQIRMETSTWKNYSFNYAGAMQSYRQAFRDLGVDVETLPVDAAIAQLNLHPRIIMPVATALDDFVEAQRLTLGDDDAGWHSLVEMARGIDPDPLRDQLRATWGGKMTPETQTKLRELGASFDIRQHSPTTAVGLAETLRRSQILDTAEQILRKAQQNFPGDFWVNMDLGILLSDSKQYVESARFFSAALAIKPTSAVTVNNLGNSLGDQGKLNEAIDCYRKAIELDAKFVYARSNLGSALTDQGKLDEAIVECRTAIELDPNFAPAHSNLGNALTDQGKLNEAITEYREAIRLDPKFADPHGNLGNALRVQGKLDEAIDEYRQAAELDPKNAKVFFNLGNALSDQGQLDAAIVEYRTAIKLDPNYAKAHGGFGNALRVQGKLDEAIDEYRQAAELDPKNAKVFFNLGNALSDQGQLDAAIVEYRTAIKLDPKLTLAHTGLGNALSKQGKLDEAITEYRKAIELDPKYAPTHNNLGNALNDQGKLNEAIAEFRAAIKLDSNYAKAHNNLGNALRELGQLNEAIAEYRKAIELDPNDAKAHHNLGAALADQGKQDEAIAEYRKAIELDPKFVYAHYGLGNALAELGKLDESIGECRKAIELDPKFALAHNNLGDALTNKGQLNEAIECYRQAIKLDPNNASFYTNLVWYLATAEDPALRNPSEAVTMARKATELQPQDANHWCNLGVAEYRAGNWHESVDAFHGADELIGGDGDRQHRFFLAMAHWQLGNQAQAHEAYEQAVNWLNENSIKDGEQIRFRDEAETVLGIAGKKLPETDQKLEHETNETKKSNEDQN